MPPVVANPNAENVTMRGFRFYTDDLGAFPFGYLLAAPIVRGQANRN